MHQTIAPTAGSMSIAVHACWDILPCASSMLALAACMWLVLCAVFSCRVLFGCATHVFISGTISKHDICTSRCVHNYSDETLGYLMYLARRDGHLSFDQVWSHTFW